MKIRMKTLMAGPGGVAFPGQIVDVPPETGRLLIEGGYAEAVERVRPAAGGRGDSEIEAATAPEAPEQALSPRGKRSRRQ